MADQIWSFLGRACASDFPKKPLGSGKDWMCEVSKPTFEEILPLLVTNVGSHQLILGEKPLAFLNSLKRSSCKSIQRNIY
jgi:hypothetical protein